MKSLRQSALQCLLETDLQQKLVLTHDLYHAMKKNQLTLDKDIDFKSQKITPGRPLVPELVSPQSVSKRSLAKFEGKMAFVHAIAHIEFNAINLAWDAVFRYSDMPDDYYHDWSRIAYEESLHFQMLNDYLQNSGSFYGAFTAHDGLWQMAEKSQYNLLERMAVVPRVLEARGLDVTPDMINKFSKLNDQKIVDILTKIYQDEIGHVEIGTRWFRYLCEQQQQDPVITFKDIINKYFSDKLRGPFNISARQQAGFCDAEIAWLETI